MEDKFLNKKSSSFILSIVSTISGTGKTTLIEGLISILKKRGYSVGVLKHDAHRLKIDKEGKDSYRFAEAGADNVIISSSAKLVMIKTLEEKIAVENIIALFGDLDFIFIEGFKDNDYPKIEVHRKGVDTELLCTNANFNKSTFIAVASDEALNIDVNIFDINDVDLIANFIESRKEQFKIAR